eukprot:GEZU01018000.1.p1 GENE.GEZU01018000.1~~GEZU01018000.1.p1  ORF type:complete len:187 (-),score=21.74 GEZU01018000.1:137-697(-)
MVAQAQGCVNYNCFEVTTQQLYAEMDMSTCSPSVPAPESVVGHTFQHAVGVGDDCGDWIFGQVLGGSSRYWANKAQIPGFYCCVPGNPQQHGCPCSGIALDNGGKNPAVGQEKVFSMDPCFPREGTYVLQEGDTLRAGPLGAAINNVPAHSHFAVDASQYGGGLCWCHGYSYAISESGWIGCHVLN